MAKTVSLFVDHEDILLTQSGEWLSNGHPITHRGTCLAFFKSIYFGPNGPYLQIGNNRKDIEIEDTAYFVLSLRGDLMSAVELYLSTEEWVELDPKTLSYQPGRLVCIIEIGVASLEARFLKKAYDDLLKDLQKDAQGFYLESASGRIHLG